MRILHTMIRVGDLDRSLAFYPDVLGMKLLRRQDYPGRPLHPRVRRLRPGFRQAALELTHNWDTPAYDLGNGFGHVALEVADARAACDEIGAAAASLPATPGR